MQKISTHKITSTAPIMPLLFVHGWGFDANLWADLRTKLTPAKSYFFDAGYFGSSHYPIPQQDYIAVAHSLGVLRVLKHVDNHCRGWVFINGFTRFSATTDFPNGVAVRIIDRMLARLETNPADVVNDFRRRCGVASMPHYSSFNIQTLKADLWLLRDADMRPAWFTTHPPTLILSGEADDLVGIALTRDSFDDKALWCSQAGHMLPLTHAIWCAEQIQTFLGQLNIAIR